MSRFAAVFACAAALFPAAARAQSISIAHDGIGCIQADRFPQFLARFDPKDQVSRARLHFRPSGWPHWYSVAMNAAGYNFVGVLPKPEKSLTRIEYYISVTDRSFGESRSEEFAPMVVAGPAACEQKRVLAVALSKAKAVLVSPPQGIAGLPKVPVGFSSDGVIAGASSASSSTVAGSGGTATTAASAAGVAGGSGGGAVAGASAAAAGGGGIGTTALVVGGAVLAGGAVTAAVVAGGDDPLPTGLFRGVSSPFVAALAFGPPAGLAGCTYDVTFALDPVELMIDEASGTLRFVEPDGGAARSRGGVATTGAPCDDFQFNSSDTQIPATVTGGAVSAAGASPSGSVRYSFNGTRKAGRVTRLFTFSDNNPNDDRSYSQASTTLTLQQP